LIGAAVEPASRELARQLDLKIGALLVRIEALRLADRTPIASAPRLAAEHHEAGAHLRVRAR
jgi:GntR family phosphonate transport system transcriptional regulator